MGVISGDTSMAEAVFEMFRNMDKRYLLSVGATVVGNLFDTEFER